jgi:hypothetical protein
MTSYRQSTKDALFPLAEWTFDRSAPVRRRTRGLDGAWRKAGVLDPFPRLLRSKNAGAVVQPDTAGPNVLFLRMRYVPRHFAVEFALAAELTKTGAQCRFAFCSPVLPVCNGWDVRSSDPGRVCRSCHRGNRELEAVLGLPSSFLADFVNDDDRADARRLAAGSSIADLRSTTIDGCDLGNELERSMAKWLFVGSIPETPETLDLARQFVEAAVLLVRGLNRLFDQSRPDVVVMNCGHVCWYGIAYRLLQARGVRTITYDETNLAVTKLAWVFNDREPVVDFEWDAAWARRKVRPLSAPEAGRIDELIEERRRFFLYQPDDATRPLADRVDTTPYRRVLSLFTNVLWDATVVGRNPVFADVAEWVEASMHVVEKHPDCALIVRIHPAEAEVYGMRSRQRVRDDIARRRPTLPENVFVIEAEERINSYDVVAASDSVLVYGSNIGLESVLMDKPVVVAGEAHYRGKGFTVEPATPDEYARVLESLCEAVDDSPPDSELARKYAHLAFIETQIDLGLFVDEHPHLVSDLTVTDFAARANGARTPALATIARWCLAGSPDGDGPLLSPSGEEQS